MQWTNQQQSAIDARGSDLLVAAAAGSGKTAVLVQRICSLAREGASIDTMLIVTFTNAAAAEMRQRISEAFERAGSQGDASLSAQSMRIEHASISTLHRFCITVLRTHFQAAGIDPSFRTGDDSETQVLRENAMQEAIDACFESEDSDFLELCECFRDEQIPDLAFSVYRFIFSRPDPWVWLDQAIQSCDIDEDSLRNSIWVHTLLKNARLTLLGAREFVLQEQNLTQIAGGPTTYENAAIADSQLIDSLLESLEAGYETFAYAITHIKYAMLPRKSGADSIELTDEFKKTRENFKKELKSIGEDFSQPLSQAAEDISSMTGVMRGLEKLLRTFNALYSALKSQRNLLDYNDLEQLTLRALEDETVVRSLREKYAYIFVDEYQDSNAIQEAIVSRIARPGGLFFVGDVKQSIYGFRQAEPSLFLNKYTRFSSLPGAPERKIDLNKNFRSRANVLACTNAVFKQCMRAGVTDIEYDEQAMLYPGLQHPDEDPVTQFILLCPQNTMKDDVEELDGNDAQEESENLTRIEQETLVCAQKIHELVGKKTIYDTKSNSNRLICYRDVAILLRSMRVSGPVIVQLLAAQGIPAACDAGEGYFDMPEVRQMLCLLQVVDNGLIDESLVAALHGEAVQLDEESLARIRIAYPEQSFSQACALYKEEKDDDIAQILCAFYEKLAIYRLCARYQPLDVLVSRVMHESGIYARAGALPGGAARQANLRLLCERAKSYQNTQNGSLGGFLAYAQKLRAGGDAQSAKLLSENEDVVRVMTMHKSKGLEFPVVFLLALGQRFNFRAYSDPLVLNAQLGIGMLCYDTHLRSIRSTISHTAIKKQLRHDALCEEIRVLYVAMTRARDQLFLIGSVSSSRALEKLLHPLSDSALSSACSFLQLLIPVLFPQGCNFKFLHPINLSRDGAHWEFTLVPAPRTQRLENAQEQPLSSLLESLEREPVPVNEVSLLLSLRPPERTFTQLKTSVTQLLREGEIDPALEPIHRLPQFMEQNALSGASRGTLFHTAMREIQILPLVAAQDKKKELARQLDDMASRGIFTPLERDTLDIKNFTTFFSSPMGARLLLAHDIRREWAFTWRMNTDEGETLVQGVIDCCFIEQGSWVLLDYKTDGGDPGEIIKRYRDQITLYARALTDITGLPVAEKSLYLVRRGLSFII